ncbi:EMILIN-3 isoform X2 [Vicugna pacos]|uniref:EMILIN-3 isoform X2 n=1 Tax=Vicugna pacos TaxID=30538 RepID=A0ABM5BV22_VICPA
MGAFGGHRGTPALLPPRGCALLNLSLPGGPSGVSLELGRGAGGGVGAGGGERRGPKFMLIREEPASRLPSAAPAASSAGHSAGRSHREAPGGRASELRGLRPAAGPRRASGGWTPGGGPARGQVETRGPRWAAAACRSGCAPSRRCSRGRRPRAPRSSLGPRRPVPPATASTRRDGARGCARGRTRRKGPGLFGERLERLEGDVQRLAQAYGTLSGLVASHKDPNRMTSGPRAPATPVGFGVIPEGFVNPGDRAGGPLTPPLDEILSKVTEVSNTLRTKVQLLDEVHGLALGHEAHLQRLREAPPSPLTSLALLDEYVDRRLHRLWGSLLDGFEQKLQSVQSVCDLRVQEVRQQCEEGQAASRRLHQSLDGRELALRRELSQLGTRLQGLSVAGGGSCCGQLALISARLDSLEKNLQAVSKAQRGHSPPDGDDLTRLSAAMLEGGVDGLLDGLEMVNGTEGGAQGCCLGMGEEGWGVRGFHTMLEERVQRLEERLVTLAGELNHDSAPSGRPARPLVQTELAVLEQRLVSLETSCTPSTTSAILDNLVAEVKVWQSRSEALLRQVASHAALLRQLNGTVADVQGQLAEATGSSLQGEITLLKVNLNSVSKSLTGLSDSVSQYSDAFLAANISLDERERKVEAEVHAIQDQVSSQGSQLRAGHRQVLSLRGELERLKASVADVAGGLSRCQDTAQELQHAVGHFNQRVAQVEGTCGKLGLHAAGLGRLPAESLGPREGLWSHMDQLNRTLAQHTKDIARLRDDLLDCRAQLAEQVRPGQAN